MSRRSFCVRDVLQARLNFDGLTIRGRKKDD